MSTTTNTCSAPSAADRSKPAQNSADPRSALLRYRAVLTLALSVITLPLLLLAWSISLQGALQKDISNATPGSDDSNVLRAAIRVSPSTYFDKLHGQMGFEHELLKRFATYSGKTLKLSEFDSVESMFDALDQNQIDMIASGYGISESEYGHYQSSPAYRSDQMVTVYKVGQHRPRKAAHLVDKRIGTIANSLASDELSKLQQSYPTLSWQELNTIDYVDLLSRVESQDIDVALISLTDFQMYRGAFPSLGVGFELSQSIDYHWSFGDSKNQAELASLAEAFLADQAVVADISILEERYFSPSKELNQVKAHEFARNVKRRLPKHRELIQTVAAENNLDWRFLAAISYQESNWLPKAKSRTGVRGMMMLTRQTAREMGIENRLDVENSLRGGAQYFLKLRHRLPQSITGPDRDWMALAAYNFGFGHLEDARVLTQKNGGNPNLWHDVKRTLPLLHKAEYYKQTRYGYARGREALSYVQHIRHYVDVLILKDYVAQHRDYLADNPASMTEIAALTTEDQKLAMSNVQATPDAEQVDIYKPLPDSNLKAALFTTASTTIDNVIPAQSNIATDSVSSI